MGRPKNYTGLDPFEFIIAMPNYHFKCVACHETFEALVSVGIRKTECPHCGKAGAKRLLAAPPIHFKGGGFHKTDSAAKKDTPKKA